MEEAVTSIEIEQTCSVRGSARRRRSTVVSGGC
jgi:hypothetical protein